MSALDRLIPNPRLVEVDHVDLAAPPSRVWNIVRHGELGHSRVTSALFALRTIPDRLAGRHVERAALRVDELVSSEERPGFQMLVEEPPHELVVGAIGKVWRPVIPFVHVTNADAYAAFTRAGWIKVAWALRIVPRGADTRLEFELRLGATDDRSWRKFRRYFRLIGPFSRLVRRRLLASIAKQVGTPEEDARVLPGDMLLPDTRTQVTHAITINATPEKIWPWIVQMGCGRGGFYSLDTLDNAGIPSAREIHPELQKIEVGQIIPAMPDSDIGFEVLGVDEPRTLVLGGLFDPESKRQLPFGSPRPDRYWQVTWSFVLEPLDDATTRLHVRARAAFPPSGWLHALWLRPIHTLMQTIQLRQLASRAENRLRRDSWRDVIEGLEGAARMAYDFITPRRPRSHWGLDERAVQHPYPGDELIRDPRWGWTHAVEIDAAAERVWPWVAQIGADRGGFYSYQWLENLFGCDVRNAETIHPEWQLREGDDLLLHPKLPPLRVVALEPGKYFLAYTGPEHITDEPWVAASWLFLVEPLGENRCRFISRYRVDTSDDIKTRTSFGQFLIEPIGFAMDRRMLFGVKERAEQRPPATAA